MERVRHPLMSVQYRKFRDIDIRAFDAVVAGAGFAGCVIAQQLAERCDMRVLVIEKRNRIGGCMYDETDSAGIRVNRYGPHVFHTDDNRVFEYLTRFCEWRMYFHRVAADWYGTYLPLPFNENSLEIALGKDIAMPLIERLEQEFGLESQFTLSMLKSMGGEDSRYVADFVYRNIFQTYSKKQWGSDSDAIDSSILDRVPVRLSRDDRYYRNAHQGVPYDGYAALFARILDDPRIVVCLETEAESVFGMEFAGPQADAPLSAVEIKDCVFLGPIVFTGPLDELFLQRFGRLPYRTVDFEFVTLDCEYALPCGTVNYTVTEDFTRATECKRLSGQSSSVTTLMREYPRAYEDPLHQTPLYPILSDANRERHRTYMNLVEPLPNFHAIGRLAEYTYYDMDQIVARALQASDRLCRTRGEETPAV